MRAGARGRRARRRGGMTRHDLVIRGGRVIGAGGEFTADVAVDGERIASVGLGLHGRREIEADGLYVLPGAVDGHVHMRTDRPVHVYDDTFETGTIAAAFGGVTAIVDQAQIEPGTPLLDGLRKRRSEADGACVIDYGLHVNLREPSLERAAEIPQAMAEGCPTVKLFMSYETYRLPDDILLRAMQHVARSGGMAVVHAENGAIVAELTRELEESGRMSPATFPGISPPVMEGEAAHRALAIARLSGCPLLIFHLTTADSVVELRRARDAGQTAFGEALPPSPAARRGALHRSRARTAVHGDAAVAFARAPRGAVAGAGRRHARHRLDRPRPAPAGSGREPARSATCRGRAGSRCGSRSCTPRACSGAGSICPAGSSSAALPRPACTASRRRDGWRPGTTPTSCSSTRPPSARSRPRPFTPNVDHATYDGHAGPRLAGGDHRSRRGRRRGRRAHGRAGPRPVRPPRAPGAGLTYWRDGRARHRGRGGASLGGCRAGSSRRPCSSATAGWRRSATRPSWPAFTPMPSGPAAPAASCSPAS